MRIAWDYKERNCKLDLLRKLKGEKTQAEFLKTLIKSYHSRPMIGMRRTKL